MPTRLRPATISDIKQIFAWRNDPWIISLSSSQKQVSWEEHLEWFQDILISNQHLLQIIEPQINIGAGLVRLDRMDEYQAQITIYLLREFTGQGMGVEAIISSCSFCFMVWSVHTINAYIRSENHPSISAFSKAGFINIEPSIDCPNDHCELSFHRSQIDLRNKAI